MPEFRVWCLSHEAETLIISAQDPRSAAEEWARRFDRGDGYLRIVQGRLVKVRVLRQHDGRFFDYIVRKEVTVTYDAMMAPKPEEPAP